MGKYKLTSIEFNLTHACNLKCKHCDHLSPYFSLKEEQKSGAISVEKFSETFAMLCKSAEIGTLSFLGGEPLLNRDLVEYLKAARRISPGTRISLISNGFLLPRMAAAAYPFLDEISVSIYPSLPLDKSKLSGVEEACKEHGVELELHHHAHFTYNVLSEEITDQKLVRNIFLTCSLAWKQHCHTLFDGWITRCSRLPFMDIRLKETGRISAGLLEKDGLKITESEDFPEKLRDYMETQEPLQACRFCLGTVGKRFEHAQLSKEEIAGESWTEVSARGTIDRVKLLRRLVKRKVLGHI